MLKRLYRTWLRDQTAMLLLKFLIQQPIDRFEKPTMGQVCNSAYKWADAMLKAREVE
jgi:hypothetical protein